MMKYLTVCILAATTAASAAALRPEFPVRSDIVKVGLLDDAQPPAAAADDPTSCDQVSFTRSLKYGDNDLNVLDVATTSSKNDTPRPVLLFMAGDSFTGDGGTADATVAAMQDQAMCFAARHGMVGVRMSYRLAPAAPWPAGAKDVAAAASWVHQNIDLFGGNPQEVVAIGYAAGAFHVASLLAHPEFQSGDSDIAGAILVSGIYKSGADGNDGERAYFGNDASKYNDRSVFPGLLNVDLPIVLAWSAADPPRLVAQGEKLKELLCNSPTHCPRTTLLKSRESLAAVFTATAPGSGLGDTTLELIREIEARGLP